MPDSERNRWLRAVWLHDALRDAPAEELEKWAASTPGPPELAAWPGQCRPRQGRGRGSIGACSTRCATTRLGWPSGTWSAGFSIAPTTSIPGAPSEREERAELAERLPDDPSGVLREVARARLIHTVKSGWPLLDPTVRFWNSLVATGAGSR